jgi:hypothetical protein
LDEHGQRWNSPSLDLNELRKVSPLFAVHAHHSQIAEELEPYDAIITEPTMRRTADVGRLVAAEWRRRLAELLRKRHSSKALESALSICGNRVAPPSTVGELASAGGISREHFARTFRSRTARESFCAKRLVDTFLVLQVLVMHSMGLSCRRASFESRIPYRTFLRARDRMEQLIPGSTANFRALLIHIDVHLTRN